MADTTIPLAMNGVVVPVIITESTRPLFGNFPHGVAISRSIVDGEQRFVIAVKSADGTVMLAFLDLGDLSEFAAAVSDELVAYDQDARDAA